MIIQREWRHALHRRRSPLSRYLVAMALTVALAGVWVATAARMHCEGSRTGFCTVASGQPVASWDIGPHGVMIKLLGESITIYGGRANAGAVMGWPGGYCVGWEVTGAPGPFWRLPLIGGDTEC
jgi:hypothetical protein